MLRGTRARTHSGRDAASTACGRSACTARRLAASTRRTGWSGTCRRSGHSSTTSAAASSSARRWRSSSAQRSSRTGLQNWPPRDRPTLPGPDGQIRVQWCAGAPGIVVGAGDYLDEELLLAGAELPWHTGPPGLEKGPSICHGTAGNGYAFLKAFARTGDERWLGRARRFAVHALGQVQRLRAERGRGRYSLWTGDLGAALYAADCLDGRDAYPFFDLQ